MARYLDLEKDKAKFKPSAAFGGERAYYSGDLVRSEKEGLVFIGRNDEQVKLGGRRIELGEVDAALMTLPGVNAAASAIQRTDTGNQVLVGYIVRDGNVLSNSDRELLKRLLPPTLIPMLVTVDSIPVRTSGKVDRKALPWPPPPRSSTEGPAEGSTMAWVSDQWRAVIGASGISPESNFFELGGTSLAAAQIVSQLRQHCHMLSIVDVYENPTLGAMTNRIDELLGATITEREIKIGPRWAVLFQSVIVMGAFLLQGLREMAILPVFQKIFENELGPDSWASHHALPWPAVVVYFLVFFTTLGRLLTTVMIVRPLTLGIQPGTYRRAGWTHLRLWAAERLVDLAQIQSIAGTPWARHYAWALGCHIGRDMQLHALPPVTGLGSFGDGASIETEADLAGWWIDGDLVHIGTVTVGKHARVGARCVLMPDAVIKAHSIAEPGTAVRGISRHSFSSLPSRHESIHDNDFQSTGGGVGIGILYTLALFLMDVLPILVFAPIWGLTPILVEDYNDFKGMCIGLIAMTAPGAILGGLLRAAAMVIVVRLANRSIRPGTFSWNSTNAFCAWLVHSLMAEARDSMFPIFSCLFTPNWLRLLGAKIGRNVEASTVVTLPSLLTVHDHAFLADHALAAPYELSHGKMRLGTVTIGVKSFLGNFAIAGPDTRVPDESLVGVLGSAPPGLDENEQQTGSSWLGRPPMLLPRKIEGGLNETRTFTPTAKLVIMRRLIESCRMIPVILCTLIPLTADLTVYWIMWRFGFGFALLAAGALMIGVAIVTALIYIAVKCIVVPNIKAGATHPLWSSFVWRKELADCFFYSMTLPLMLRYFLGTPIVSIFFRAIGADIGTGTWMEAAALPEANLCHLGDGATLNRGSVVQSHLFHDRLMRLDEIRLERGATIGPHSIALPGTVLGPGTTVYPISVVMRGEHLPGSTRWAGNPICPWSGEEKEGSPSSNWDSPFEV
ncbi:hypothetical protein NQ176_g9029 [Zarea fungicola]|uniref:Uncharacterized protein n=1 Tax=Zarea fungicola TaxID=93591 RepID=A0ACC1MPZ1_9HYPO|nr:hypothetical protein NQ176_g9029 [Lecanicillium fungicola]